MNERTKSIVTMILLLIAFVICLTLVITGQRNIGAAGLLTQLLGLAGLMVLLWNYNRKFR
ncbi:MAG: hypothetical protein Q4C60_08425 [Eubacteriales bacterium]|nr:hypothetical protein [Eubacteriales bacterium]